MNKKIQDFITFAALALLAVGGLLLLADKSLYIFLGALAAVFFFSGEMRQALLLLFGLPVLLFFTGQDFSAILFAATVLSGVTWIAYRWFTPELALIGEGQEKKSQSEWAHSVEQAISFFPILLIIFLFRSFLIEPFRIPSGSMKPTLIEGDFIAVNKFAYGIRLPVINKKILDLGSPERGDVVVFRFPHDLKLDYIKRVVGLPGDRILYGEKSLSIKPSCKGLPQDSCPKLELLSRTLIAAQGFDDNGTSADVYSETLGEREHKLLIRPMQADPAMQALGRPVEFIVPDGQYFVMGDNRDGSNDSRFWGFVPDENLKGEAVAVWMHLDFGFENKWISWVPTGVSVSRIGSIQ